MKSDPTAEKKCSDTLALLCTNPPVKRERKSSVFSSARLTLMHPSTNPDTATAVNKSGKYNSFKNFFMSLATLVLF